MSHVNHLRIGPELQGEKVRELATVLESVFPVRFSFASDGLNQCSGEIVADAARLSATDGDGAMLDRLIIPPTAPHDLSAQPAEIRVRFGDETSVPFPFQGRSLTCKVGVRPEPLKLMAGEKALLTCERGVLWAQSEVRGVKVFRSTLVLPAIPPQGNLHDILNGDRFLELLPLLHFLRTVSGYYQWQRPPVQAQFMFDDPNLHWPTYGLVKYQEIATRAAKENYHVSFATVPLDGWFTNGRAAEIFRSNPGRLSLCVHGNDHTKKELAQNYTSAGRVSLLRQAIRRIEKLERRAGVPVARVMVPPHGACAHEMLAEIPGCGFESACISHGSLRAHNRTKPWTKTLGYLPVENIGGCPVLPRWGFVGTTESTIFLAAFLDQALVLRGHHQDLKDGIELLDGFARIINRLGNVAWRNMSEISQRSCYSHVEAKSLRLRPWVNKVVLKKPVGADEVTIDDVSTSNASSWALVNSNGTRSEISSGARASLAGHDDKMLILEKTMTPPESVYYKNRVPAAAFVRRLLTEGRDRFQGVFGCK